MYGLLGRENMPNTSGGLRASNFSVEAEATSEGFKVFIILNLRTCIGKTLILDMGLSMELSLESLQWNIDLDMDLDMDLNMDLDMDIDMDLAPDSCCHR